MKNILTIIKKEFSRFFKDRRMVISVLLPGLLIYVLYSIMGTAMSNFLTTDEDYKFSAYVLNMPLNEQLNTLFESTLEFKEYDDIAEAKSDVTEGNLDLVIVFPENFDEVIGGTSEEQPNVGVFYNSSETNSSNGYFAVNGMLEAFKNPAFSVNIGQNSDLADERDAVGGVLAGLMPMILLSLLVSGCMSVAPEAIAGEKERGTMATMLITPIKRWQLALGKILSLSCFAFLSGLSSFIGVMLSMPKLMGGAIGSDAAAYYSFGDYAMLLVIIISLVLVIISAFSVLSALAKSVKEASSLIAPLMIIIILSGVFSMFVSNSAAGLFAVPLLGSVLAISSILTFSITQLAFALSVISNVVIAAALIVGLSFMFKSEKIMFNK